MLKTINSTHIEGYLYEHNLTFKIAGPDSKNPGVRFINGTVSIATDEELLNVIQVHYSYVTEITSRGKPNPSFNVLSNIIEGKLGSVMEHGKENAAMIRADSSIGLNEWYDREGNLVSQRRNEGGFIHVATELVDKIDQRATFHTDIVITNCVRNEADEERQIPERVTIKGAVFDFRGNLLPVEFSVVAEEGMNYFESLNVSNKNPVFTRVRGKQVSQTVVRTITEESAFGAPFVREVKSSFRDFVVTRAKTEPYEWDTEDTITAAEMKEAMAQREITLAEIKRRQDEYRASKNNNFGNLATSVKDEKYYF